MKVDRNGTQEEKARYYADWRTAGGIGAGRCDECARAEKVGGAVAHCPWLNAATRPNATCEFHSPTSISQGDLMTIHKDQLDALTGSDNLPTVGEMIKATTPIEDKALPVLKTTGTEIEPYDARRIIGECRALMSQSAEAMLEAGKRLIELKKHEPHGEFERILLDDLHLEPRVARRMMSAAIKFSVPTLEVKRTTLSVLGKSKLFELMTEDEEDLAELADGGTLAGKTLDEIDRMSVRELKAALRKAKEDARQEKENLAADLEASRKRIAKKDERINELEDQLENRKSAPPDPMAEASKYVIDLHSAAVRAVSIISTDIRARGLAVLDAHTGNLADHGRLHVAQALGQIISAARAVAADLAILPAENTPSVFGLAGDDDQEIWEATMRDFNAQKAAEQGE